MSPKTESLLILGGGPAGLAAAWYGSRAGLDVTLLEASGVSGGNARTFEIDRFRFDTGAHRFHDRDPEVTADVRRLLGDDLRRIDVPSAIREGGRFLDFPLDPVGLLRHLSVREIIDAGLQLVRARMRGVGSNPDFREYAVHRYGRSIAERYLLGYSRKLWGVDPAHLAPEVAGGRLRGIDLRTFLNLALRKRTERTRHLDGSFWYPVGGIGMIADAISESLPSGSIHLNEPVVRIETDGDRVVCVVTSEQEYEVDPGTAVISTLPADLFVRIVTPAPPEDIRRAGEGMEFRTLRLVLGGIERRSLSPYASVYFPSPSVPFTRLYESTNRSRSMAPEGNTAIALELPTGPDDPWSAASDEAVLGTAMRLLESEFGVTEREVRFLRTITIPNAYPVLTVDGTRRAEQTGGWIGTFSNLYPLGRNQTFRYLHLHDLLRAGRDLVVRLTAGR